MWGAHLSQRKCSRRRRISLKQFLFVSMLCHRSCTTMFCHKRLHVNIYCDILSQSARLRIFTMRRKYILRVGTASVIVYMHNSPVLSLVIKNCSVYFLCAQAYRMRCKVSVYILYCDRPKSIFGNNSDSPKPIRTKFYIKTGLIWEARRKLGAIGSTLSKWRRKNELLSAIRCLGFGTCERSICLKFVHNMWIGVVISPSGKNPAKFFSVRGHLPKTDIF